jgi:predicted metal-dependent peptidase
VLGYNPSFIQSMPLEKVKGLQCHEVLHLACLHHTRRGGRDKKLWNTACDYAINPLLLEAGLELPSGYLDDPAHYGKSADAIYAALIDRDEAKGGAEGLGGEGVETDADAEDASGTAAKDEQEHPGDPGDKPAEQEARSQDDASGGAGEAASAGAEESNDPGGSGEVRDAPSDSRGFDATSDMQQEEDAWRMALAEALHKSRQAGELPGALERLLEGAVAPRLDWRELLHRFLDNAARNDFSWIRPNRRFLHTGLILPGMDSQELAEVAVAVDVSGSVTQAELDAFASELSELLEAYEAGLRVLACDAALTESRRLSRWDLPLEFEAKGGGGTDFRPPFKRLQDEGPAPACLIYFTDLECDKFPEEPDYPVLWVTPNARHAPPPFGEVITMEEP